MKVGFALVGRDPSTYVAIAKKAEEVGYESVWIREHLVMPAELPATYPYGAGGRGPLRSGSAMFDPWVILSYMAAVTQRVRLGTCVYILPLRNPIVTARAVATVDQVSRGRVILGAGIGWLREEFEAVGEGWENRARRTVEIVEIIKKLWTEDTIQYQGQYYSFLPVKFQPKPVQRPHPPIQWGGDTPPALRRAAQLGDGWIGTHQSAEETAEFVQRLKALRQAAGLPWDGFEITTATAGPVTVDTLRRYAEAGADRVLVRPWPEPEGRRLTLEQILDGVEQFAEDVLSKLKE